LWRYLTYERGARLITRTRADELADDAAMKVEKAIAGSDRFGGLASSVAYAGMTSDYSDEQREGSLTLSWTVRYTTKSTTPNKTN